MTNNFKKVALLLLIGFFLTACAYIVTPEPITTPTSASSKGWSAFVTKVGPSEIGDLRIEISIRNDTAEWSVMQAVPDKPALLTSKDGKTTDCETVFVGTGGNSLAPGFQMRGYTGGTKMEPQTQLLYVECKGVKAEPGSTLKISYSYTTGNLSYYITPKATNGDLTLNLDEVVSDAKYPIGEKIDGLIEKPGVPIEAINKCMLTLTDVKRTDTGLELYWDNTNPSQSPTYVHNGKPPVIGSDGIIYGFYESPHLADTPITPVGGKSNWTTTVVAPKDATGLYLLVGVESKQQRYFIFHVIDLTDK
jgi:hypothetical protein